MKQITSALVLTAVAVSGYAAAPMRKVDVTLKGPHGEVAVVHAEVADTEQLREYGLMNRDSMPADDGMIFTWPRAQKVGFWMKDTHIPLDMLFANHGYVVAVAQAKPMDETVISPPDQVDAVLEVNGGWSAAHKLGPGWTLSLSK